MPADPPLITAPLARESSWMHGYLYRMLTRICARYAASGMSLSGDMQIH